MGDVAHRVDDLPQALAVLGSALAGVNTGSRSAHCSFVTSLRYDMPRTVLVGPPDAVEFKWDTPSKAQPAAGEPV